MADDVVVDTDDDTEDDDGFGWVPWAFVLAVVALGVGIVAYLNVTSETIPEPAYTGHEPEAALSQTVAEAADGEDDGGEAADGEAADGEAADGGAADGEAGGGGDSESGDGDEAAIDADAVAEAIADAGGEDVSFEIDGDTVVLSGEVADEDVLAAVVEAVEAVDGVGSVDADQIAVVGAGDAGIDEGDLAGTIDLALDDRQVVISGAVPSDDVKATIVFAAATELGAGRVVDELRVDPDVVADDLTLQLTGSVSDPERAATWEQLVADLGEGLGIAVDEPTVVVEDPPELETALNAVVEAEPVQFATGSADILPASVATLDQLVELLADFPDGSVEIQGHTDAVGDAAQNQALSEARAQSVLDYFVNAGVDESRLTSVGFGSTRPLADPEVTDEDRQINRRTEFVVST